MATKHGFEAIVEDPLTGESTTFVADSEAELDRLVDEHLASSFPAPEELDG